MAVPANTLFDFSDASAVEDWRSVNDDVMGGVSESRFVSFSEETAAFEGRVSLEQGGGFASIRAPERLRDLSAFYGLLIRARGDGQRYNLTLHMSSENAISYRFPFVTDDTWTDYFAPFDALTPMKRGQHVPDASPFDASSVATLGFLIGDRQAGPFRLELRWIKAVSQP